MSSAVKDLNLKNNDKNMSATPCGLTIVHDAANTYEFSKVQANDVVSRIRERNFNQIGAKHVSTILV